MKTSRRDFVRGAGGALAGVVLSHCGGGDSDKKGAAVPNGYRFHRLFTTGDSLPGSGEARYLPPSVKISDANQILFHAADAVNGGPNMGLYELLMDYDGSAPKVVTSNKVVRAGDTLPDGKEVFQVALVDVNHRGSVAVRLLNKGEQAQSLYLERARANGSSAAGLERVLGFDTPAPDGKSFFGGWLGNFDLHDDDEILVACSWGSREQDAGGESVFRLPGGTVSSQGSILMTAGDLLPNGTHVVNKFGLLQGHTAGGAYAVQTHTAALDASAADSGSAVLKGTSGDPNSELAVIAASEKQLASIGAAPIGHVYYGPRINSNGDVAIVTHVTATDVVLTVGGSPVAKTGDSTPSGKVVSGLGGPVMAEGGLVFFVAATTDKTQELLVWNGTKLTSVLSTGTRLFGSSSPKLLTIALGYAREQADTEGRIVFVGEFDDNTLSIVLGTPV